MLRGNSLSDENGTKILKVALDKENSLKSLIYEKNDAGELFFNFFAKCQSEERFSINLQELSLNECQISNKM